MNNLLGIISFLVLAFAMQGQVSTSTWRKELKIAQDHQSKNEFLAAAESYRAVFNSNNKLDVAEQAAVCYLKGRNYKAVTTLLENLLDRSDPHSKLGYYYAFALQYLGSYAKAKLYYDAFLRTYRGADMKDTQVQIERSLLTCNYGIQAQSKGNTFNKIERLSHVINSSKADFAPQPFSDDILYFSSCRSGHAQVYRTVFRDTQWTNPQIPPVYIGTLDFADFGNGSFSEDGKRYYFTQCKSNTTALDCFVYYMELNAKDKWTTPQRLPSYINSEGANTTHPHVSTHQGYDVLYFASDRPGGVGGMDIWYSTRKVGTSLTSFTLPKNVGSVVNTKGDELSPFYHSNKGELYFSSNGLIGVGGLDVFKSEGHKVNWKTPQNLGVPINSSTDDLYFVLSEAHGGAYMVSNRSTLSKNTTIDDDIFYVSLAGNGLILTGKIMNADSLAIPNTMVKLYALHNTHEYIVDSLYSHDGIYQFASIDADSNYILECVYPNQIVQRFSFVPTTKQTTCIKDLVSSALSEANLANKALSKLELYHLLVPQVFNSLKNFYALPIDPKDPSTNRAYTGDTLSIFYELDALAGLAHRRRLYYDSSGILQPLKPVPLASDELPTLSLQNKSVRTLYPEKEAVVSAVFYKIQVAAVRNFKPEKFEVLEDIGSLSLEKVNGDLRRVLVLEKQTKGVKLNGYKRKSTALNALAQIIDKTRFRQAFVVKYLNGQRVGSGFRSWDESAGLETEARPDGLINID
jgi:tetratricopeptide (TPR) repeat protein